MARIGRVREDRHTSDLGDGFREQLQPLADFHVGVEGYTGDVPARAREACNESQLDRVADANHDDWNRSGGVLGGYGGGRRPRYDDVYLEPDQLGCEIGQPVKSALRESIVDQNV